MTGCLKDEAQALKFEEREKYSYKYISIYEG
jgi:hypothetical protein